MRTTTQTSSQHQRAEVGEAVDVVDVGRTGTARAPPAPAPPRRRARRGGAPRATPRAGSRPGCGRARRGRCPSSVAARSRAASARPLPKLGCMRLTMSARTAMSASAELGREELRLLDRVAPGRRHEHERRLVGRQQLRAPRRPARGSPPPSPRRRWKNAMASSITSPPTTLATVRRNVCAATFTAFITPRPGAVTMRNRRWSRKRVQAPRGVDEVEGVAGGRRVDDDEVEVGALVQLVELLHRHVLLRARQRAGDVAVEAVLEDARALLGGGGVGHHEVVEGALGVEHQRPQLARPVAVDARGRAGEALEAERVGQALGRVDGDDHGAASGPRRLERQHGGGGRLADAAGAAAHEDAALHDAARGASATGVTRPPGARRPRR